ncbi:MAG: RsmD family RNA methyltransferase [Chloroflexota bacterium]
MRVIAGAARGRPLDAPRSEHTRPTADKVKGAIFSMLEAEAYRRGYSPTVDADDETVYAAAACWPRVLELYAGSGALSIEALSRGAAHADFVESDREARSTIAANLKRTRLDAHAQVHNLDSRRVASTWARPFDLLLLDPPYDEPDVPVLLGQIAERNVAAEGAVTVWEHASSLEPPAQIGASPAAPRWVHARTNTHGAAAISLYFLEPPESASTGDHPESSHN